MWKMLTGFFQALAGVIPYGATTDLAHTEEDAERGKFISRAGGSERGAKRIPSRSPVSSNPTTQKQN